MAQTCCPDGYTYGVPINICQCWTIISEGCVTSTYSVNYCDGTTGTVTLVDNQTLTVCALNKPTAISVVQCPFPNPGGNSFATQMGICTKPTGGTYHCVGAGSPTCFNSSNEVTDPINCPCCPVGYIYIDENGQYNDPGVGTGTITNTDPTPFYNTCIATLNRGWAVPSGQEPVTCSCCPDGYTYSSFLGYCIGASLKDTTSAIPCLACNCTSAPAFECNTCGTAGERIVFQYSYNTKYCTDCIPDDGQLTKNGKLNCFLPAQFISPAINFTLRNKNFI